MIYYSYIHEIMTLKKIMDRLNNIELTIDFTYKLKNNNTLPFLDILLINNYNELEFKVHHNSTNKNSSYTFLLA